MVSRKCKARRGRHLEISFSLLFLMSHERRKSGRNTKPVGYYKALVSGNMMANNREGDSPQEEEADSELLELKRMEKGLESEVEEKKEVLKQKREEEKVMLRQKIAVLKQQARDLETQLKSVSSPRSRHASRSLPDDSEYQKLLLDLCREGQKGKDEKKKKKRDRLARRNKRKLEQQLK